MTIAVTVLMGGTVGYGQEHPGQDRPPTTTAISEAISANLLLREIHFDPLASGRNRVVVRVRNQTAQPQVLMVDVQTRGSAGTGWGTQHTYKIGPQQEQDCPFIFKISGPIDKQAKIQLRLANPATKREDSQEMSQGAIRKIFSGATLERRRPDTTPGSPASPEQAAAIVNEFSQIQELLRGQRFADVWEALTDDYQNSEFFGREDAFVRTMRKEQPLFGWARSQLMDLAAGNVEARGDFLILHAASAGQEWMITFAQDQDQWKIDDVAGYTDRVLLEKHEPRP